uniref:DUF4379 domain-containing protein n=1 Tax=Panagrellus redivivus TaxID=6233 RepID=A0A7E5A0F5_PANRE
MRKRMSKVDGNAKKQGLWPIWGFPVERHRASLMASIKDDDIVNAGEGFWSLGANCGRLQRLHGWIDFQPPTKLTPIRNGCPFCQAIKQMREGRRKKHTSFFRE